MKLMLFVTAVAGAVGVWAGFSGWQLGVVRTTVEAGVTVLTGGSLLICSWAWWRAKPGSGDAMVSPTLMLLWAGLLIGILPRLFWPSADNVHMVGSIASAVIVTAIAVVEFRKRRRLRAQAKPA